MKKNRQKVETRPSRLQERDLVAIRGGAIVGGGREPDFTGVIVTKENGSIVVNDNGTIIIY